VDSAVEDVIKKLLAIKFETPVWTMIPTILCAKAIFKLITAHFFTILVWQLSNELTQLK
jgi:hypothetical protein